MTKTLIIGLGNPILGDDGVGWKVAEQVKQRIESDARFHMPMRPLWSKIVHHLPSAEVDYAALGGLSLMERLVGYQRVILVDSMETGQSPEGSVRVFPLEQLTNPSASHSTAAHDRARNGTQNGDEPARIGDGGGSGGEERVRFFRRTLATHCRGGSVGDSGCIGSIEVDRKLKGV
jgi:hydrogenase maturation protease